MIETREQARKLTTQVPQNKDSGSEIFCEPVRSFLSRCTAQQYVVHWNAQMRQVKVSYAEAADMHGDKPLVSNFCNELLMPIT